VHAGPGSASRHLMPHRVRDMIASLVANVRACGFCAPLDAAGDATSKKIVQLMCGVEANRSLWLLQAGGRQPTIDVCGRFAVAHLLHQIRSLSSPRQSLCGGTGVRGEQFQTFLQRPREPGALVFLRHIDLVAHNPTRRGRDVLNFCLEPKTISGGCGYAGSSSFGVFTG
jgi:hypothetical protein